MNLEAVAADKGPNEASRRTRREDFEDGSDAAMSGACMMVIENVIDEMYNINSTTTYVEQKYRDTSMSME